MARFLPLINNNDNLGMNTLKRQLRERNDAFNLPEQRFIELYRFDKQTMREIIQWLEPHLQPGIRQSKISKSIRILTAMRFYATGSYQRCVGQDCLTGMSQAQVSRVIAEVTGAIEEHLGQWIQFPMPEEYLEIKQRFMEQYNMPGVVGVVDGTHIAICNPGRNIEQAYFNRKGFHSKNVQIICDMNYKILGINASYGGATHDAFIWRDSQAKAMLEERFNGGDRNSWLLGDSGYPLMPFLLTPFRNPAENSPKFRYNLAHRRARSCVERCIGILKARFRCLLSDRVLKYTPQQAGSIINACAILHNIMMNRNLLLPEVDMVENNDDDEAPVHQEQPLNIAVHTRARVVRNYFN